MSKVTRYIFSISGGIFAGWIICNDINIFTVIGALCGTFGVDFVIYLSKRIFPEE